MDESQQSQGGQNQWHNIGEKTDFLHFLHLLETRDVQNGFSNFDFEKNGFGFGSVFVKTRGLVRFYFAN